MLKTIWSSFDFFFNDAIFLLVSIDLIFHYSTKKVNFFFVFNFFIPFSSYISFQNCSVWIIFGIGIKSSVEKKYRYNNLAITTPTQLCTGIPRLTRFLWQPKNCVRRNSRYASQSIEKKICITRKSYTIKSCYANFFRQAQKTALYKSAL